MADILSHEKSRREPQQEAARGERPKVMVEETDETQSHQRRAGQDRVRIVRLEQADEERDSQGQDEQQPRDSQLRSGQQKDVVSRLDHVSFAGPPGQFDDE